MADCDQVLPCMSKLLSEIGVLIQASHILLRKSRSSKDSALGASCRKLKASVTCCDQVLPPTSNFLQYICELVHVGNI